MIIREESDVPCTYTASFNGGPSFDDDTWLVFVPFAVNSEREGIAYGAGVREQNNASVLQLLQGAQQMQPACNVPEKVHSLSLSFSLFSFIEYHARDIEAWRQWRAGRLRRILTLFNEHLSSNTYIRPLFIYVVIIRRVRNRSAIEIGREISRLSIAQRRITVPTPDVFRVDSLDLQSCAPSAEKPVARRNGESRATHFFDTYYIILTGSWIFVNSRSDTWALRGGR